MSGRIEIESRRVAREIVMKQMYSRLVKGEGEFNEIMSLSSIQTDVNENDRKYADEVLEGVEQNIPEIDEHIKNNLKNWSMETIALVDKCILRLAIYEMLYREDVPVSVAINEAVELAKQFCDEKSPSFVNGVLGGVSREEKKETLE